MKFVSPVLKRVLYPALQQTGYFRRRRIDGNLCVITYHGVLPQHYKSRDPILDGNLVSATTLRRQLRVLKSRYRVVNPAEVLVWLEIGTPLPARSILLTCDDGLQNVLTDMAPVLCEEGVSCLFFVTGASTSESPQMLWYEELYLLLMATQRRELSFPELGMAAQLEDRTQRRSIWWIWVKELSRQTSEVRRAFLEELAEQTGLSADWRSAYEAGPSRRRFFVMNASELRQLASLGMAIGAHTMSHPVLAQAASDMVRQEMTQSAEALRRVLETPVWAMAYPFGDPASAGAREFGMAELAGYKCAFLNFGGGFCPSANISRFSIPRLHVTTDMGLGEFEAHVSGFHESLRRRFSHQDPAFCA
jgi:peptidoglycan/xylan/chitin deacetylase (PgdA/CDA1 family)